MIKKLISMIASVMPNFVKLNLYRLVGYKIGKNVKIGFMTLILANKVKIEDNVRIGALNIFRMNKLIIGSDSIIRSLNMMLGPKNLKLGKRIQIVGPFTFMNLAEDIELDDRCGLGSHSIFYTHGVYLPYTEGNPRKFGKIYLGKRVWSPCHVVFLPGVNIGDDSIITTGSVVNSSFPKNSLIAGNPAKMISKASNLKTVMTKEKLHERMREIISGFTRNNFLENTATKMKGDELIIKKNKKQYLIRLQNGNKIENIQDYDEIIILGDNLPKPNSKKISLFDFKERKMVLRGGLSKIFLEHLGTYGEYFN
jgi:acetyltransferase-like isoleucine patch superfamily enzyme